jgi:predicted DNA-binding WGR domain protein
METRTDPTRNMNRSYVVDVTPTLFREWVLRKWGRRGSPGTLRLPGTRCLIPTAVKKAMATGPEFREDPASISAEEQARRRQLAADQRAQPIPAEWIRAA